MKSLLWQSVASISTQPHSIYGHFLKQMKSLPWQPLASIITQLRHITAAWLSLTANFSASPFQRLLIGTGSFKEALLDDLDSIQNSFRQSPSLNCMSECFTDNCHARKECVPLTHEKSVPLTHAGGVPLTHEKSVPLSLGKNYPLAHDWLCALQETSLVAERQNPTRTRHVTWMG